MCAGIYAGFFKDYDDASITCRKITGKVVPNRENHEQYQKIFKKYKKISKFLVGLANED